MADFVQAMQSVVLDNPVVDQTGRGGRYKFDLYWKPDGSQYPGIAQRIPSSTDAPPLQTAVQEQLGLKLDLSRAPVELLVMDHIEESSLD